MYNLALLFIFSSFGLLGFGFYFFLKIKESKKLQHIRSLPFDQKYREYLRRIELYRNLPKEDKERIERTILEFIYTKEFLGVQLKVTEEMKVVIAFHACLLLFKSKLGGCYQQLKTVIIYPTTVAIENMHNNSGIYTKEKLLIDGQSTGDTVVIIWNNAKREAYHHSYNNVIIHEFAHEIDFMNGAADGIPPLESSKYYEWVSIIYKDFQKMSQAFIGKKDIGKYKFLGEYAVTNKAEFFAVITERFFESPNILKKKFPELYNELKDFYGIDPISNILINNRSNLN
ncbi:zinc-dependent peptidase [Hydrogenimonas thermophila]|uniref:Zinc-dependent peptidase n=1 Tax=Hydrogenimonas thermophila TaxID=223786 RepID=A0A1I5TNX3_9BACT|nr:M90 family metallopeptidase [Hydrogenimonas thermophila]SFP84591.1 hypothetical protein SAMN05216234_14612 [Hydrogenimonas thermophila]